MRGSLRRLGSPVLPLTPSIALPVSPGRHSLVAAADEDAPGADGLALDVMHHQICDLNSSRSEGLFQGVAEPADDEERPSPEQPGSSTGLGHRSYWLCRSPSTRPSEYTCGWPAQ